MQYSLLVFEIVYKPGVHGLWPRVGMRACVCVCLCVCLCVSVCVSVSAPKGINNQWHDMV